MTNINIKHSKNVKDLLNFKNCFKKENIFKSKKQYFEQRQQINRQTQNLVFLIILNLYFRKSDNFLNKIMDQKISVMKLFRNQKNLF